MTRKIKKSFVFHRRLNYQYPVITRGRGIYLFDKSGKKYIDGTGGALVANLGHGIAELAKEIGKSARRFSYLHGSQFTTNDMEDYARELVGVAPKGLDRVFFVSGGSEAVESAVKLARQYHFDSGKKNKYLVIRRKPGYHGSTVLGMSLSGRESQRRPFLPYLLKFPVIPAPFCYHCPFNDSYPKCGLKCARALEKAIKKAGPQKVAAFIAEPVIGASAGAVLSPPGYFKLIRKICDKYNVLLILDEVMAGFGRTGKWFACQHWKVSPDILVTAKGIGGGFVPLAAVFCREKVFRTIKKGNGNFIHGFTFENNPLTTATGRQVLRYVKKRNLVKKSAALGKYLLVRLHELEKIDIVGDVRGRGLMTAVEFVANKKTRQPFSRDRQVAEKIVQTALKKGLNLYFSIAFTKGNRGDAVMVAPPFIVTKKEIDKIVAILRETILEVSHNLK